jgi:hypothetical protein
MAFTVVSIKTDRAPSFSRDNWPSMAITYACAVDGQGQLHELEFSDSPDADLERLCRLLDDSARIVAYNGREFEFRVLEPRVDPARLRSWLDRLVDPFEAMRDLGGSWVKLSELLDANSACQAAAARTASDDARSLWRAATEMRVLRFPVKRGGATRGWGTLNWALYCASR